MSPTERSTLRDIEAEQIYLAYDDDEWARISYSSTDEEYILVASKQVTDRTARTPI